MSDLAIESSIPCLFGLYSEVMLLCYAYHPTSNIPFQQTAWYHKQQATLGDLFATVGRQFCGKFRYSKSPNDSELLFIPVPTYPGWPKLPVPLFEMYIAQ